MTEFLQLLQDTCAFLAVVLFCAAVGVFGMMIR